MRIKYAALLLAVIITGCNDNKEVFGCSSEMTKSTLMDLIKKSAYEDLSEQVDEYPDVTNQTKRSALDKIKLAISEVSTTSSDSGSTMKTCEATVTMSISADEYNKLYEAYRANFGRNLDKQLENLALENNANVFSKRISYTAQATDDQENVFVKTSADNAISSGASLLTALSIINPIVEQQKVQQEKEQQQRLIEAQQKAQQQTLQQTQQQEQRQEQQPAYQQPQQNISDTLPQSRIQFANADSDLSTAWSSFSPEKKKELLPSQRQWIKTKDAMCGKVSMQGNDSEVKKMLDCQTQMTLSRIQFLRNQ